MDALPRGSLKVLHTEGCEAIHASLSEVPALQAWTGRPGSKLMLLWGTAQPFIIFSEPKVSCPADLKDLDTYSGKLPFVRHSTESRRVATSFKISIYFKRPFRHI